MFLIILISFIASASVPLFYRIGPKFARIVMPAVPMIIFLYFSSLYSGVISGDNIRLSIPWFTALDVNFSFYIDGLGLLFSLLISGIGFVVFLFATGYMKGDSLEPRFFIYLYIFMGAMIGVVTADNLIVLFLFWELTSISSYLLIGYYNHQEKSRYAALQALLVTGTGGISLLAAFILIYFATGSFEFSYIKDFGLLSENVYYPYIAILIILGAFTKSAQFPFHFWLPNAMAAPGPVSAYLHSATMVKAGVFILAKFNPLLGGEPIWNTTLLTVGLTTAVISIFLALKQTDIKKLLAYSTVSALGTMVFLNGIGSEKALLAMVVYLIAHALYKATLFLVAGTIDHETGTRNVNRLYGLGRHMPYTAAAALIASFSQIGIIPMLGFTGKESLLAAILTFEGYTFLLTVLVFFSSAGMVYVAINSGLKPFWGKTAGNAALQVHEAPYTMWAGPILLGLISIFLGIYPPLLNNLVQAVYNGISKDDFGIDIYLWHGFNAEFIIGTLIILAGISLYFFRERIYSVSLPFGVIKYIKPSFYYDSGLQAIISFSKLQTRLLQNGYLRYYILLIISTVLLLAGYPVIQNFEIAHINSATPVTFVEVILALLLSISVLATIRAKSRLAAVVSIGVVGYSLSLLFVVYGAPDLAMTQFAVETLTVVLFVLIIYRLPKFLPASRISRRLRDGLVAGMAGVMMTAITLMILFYERESELKNYFLEKSLSEGKGKNVVNVILVDFRALDTIGEITVLAIAAIGVFALIGLKSREKKI